MHHPCAEARLDTESISHSQFHPAFHLHVLFQLFPVAQLPALLIQSLVPSPLLQETHPALPGHCWDKVINCSESSRKACLKIHVNFCWVYENAEAMFQHPKYSFDHIVCG